MEVLFFCSVSFVTTNMILTRKGANNVRISISSSCNTRVLCTDDNPEGNDGSANVLGVNRNKSSPGSMRGEMLMSRLKSNPNYRGPKHVRPLTFSSSLTQVMISFRSTPITFAARALPTEVRSVQRDLVNGSALCWNMMR